MKLYDSLRRDVFEFEPSTPGRVSIYGCGPTIYDFAHIGNFRTFMVYDLLHRRLRQQGLDVTFIVNFTDVDDKTIEGAAAAGRSLEEHTAPFGEAFLADARSLGILPFTDHPRATGFIEPMVGFIQRLVDKGHAYQADDGSVYYSVSSFDEYGKLSGNRADGESGQSRIDADEYEKGDVRDFVLWKATRPKDEEVGAVWDSPWGPGRPGWHLECSVMGTTLLGDTLDIHLGGEDLLFPHHENEIAQSEGATGHPFVRFWMHVKHLKVADRKMSKSLGNFHTVRELLEEGYDPAAIRWVLLSAHYRHELNFTRAGLDDATASIQRLLDFRRRVANAPETRAVVGLAPRADGYRASFQEALDDDLNVPEAMVAVWGLVKEMNAALDGVNGIGAEDRDGILACLEAMDQVLGVLDLAADARSVDDAAERRIQELVDARDRARAERDFETADRLREELAAEGVVVEDGPGGTLWKKVI